MTSQTAIPINIMGTIYRIDRDAYESLVQLAQDTGGDRTALGAAIRRYAETGKIAQTNIHIGQRDSDEPTE